jgi:glycosyltransferase WbpL
MDDLMLFAAITVVSGISVFGLRRWLNYKQILDVPNARSSHTRPTPRGGGALIVIVTLLGLIAFNWSKGAIDWGKLIPFAVGGAFLAAISWLDDLHSLPAKMRLTVHAACALLAIAAFGYWQELFVPILGSVYLGWFGVLITLIWIVGLTNAYNFMDGIDGLAGSQALVGGLGWVVLGQLSQQPLITVTGLLVAASSLGFLWQNWPPAKIFMGDVGSAFLGYTFAAITVMASQNDPKLTVSGVMLVWPFVFDASFTLLRRVRRRQNLLQAHREHLYQRLIIANMPHWMVTVLYLLLAIIGILLAVIWDAEVSNRDGVIVLTLLTLSVGLFVLTTYRTNAYRRAKSDWSSPDIRSGTPADSGRL